MTTQEVTIPLDNQRALYGTLSIPDKAIAIVVFVHGSGSSRFSPRNRLVAESLNQSGLATLLFDLLTPEEEAIDEETTQYRFDIPMLSLRLIHVTRWLQQRYAGYIIGYFGASTGAAAALIASSRLGGEIKAVVSRGGRADLAGDALPHVIAPTLLIVGEYDEIVLDLNQQAQQQLTCEHTLAIVPGATHLFEERGTLEQVIQLAEKWFLTYLVT